MTGYIYYFKQFRHLQLRPAMSHIQSGMICILYRFFIGKKEVINEKVIIGQPHLKNRYFVKQTLLKECFSDYYNFKQVSAQASSSFNHLIRYPL